MHDSYHGGCRRNASIARLFVNSFQLNPTRLYMSNLGVNVTHISLAIQCYIVSRDFTYGL